MRTPEGDACDRCGKPVTSTKESASDGGVFCAACDVERARPKLAACGHCGESKRVDSMWTFRTIAPSGESCDRLVCDECRARFDEWLLTMPSQGLRTCDLAWSIEEAKSETAVDEAAPPL